MADVHHHPKVVLLHEFLHHVEVPLGVDIVKKRVATAQATKIVIGTKYPSLLRD